MAAPKLDEEQRETLLMWMAAEYDSRLIRKWFSAKEWPSLSRAAFAYYRKRYGHEIEALRAERRGSALNTGLALREERVARLAAHADELEALKWVPDEHGKFNNEKAWRETLADIAAEVGHRKNLVEHSGAVQIEYVNDWRNQ